MNALMRMPTSVRLWAGALAIVLSISGVPDADAAIAKAEAKGGKGFFPPIDMPGMGRFTWLSDDQGGVFGVFQPSAQ